MVSGTAEPVLKHRSILSEEETKKKLLLLLLLVCLVVFVCFGWVDLFILFFINNFGNGTELVPKFVILTVPTKKSPEWYCL